MSHVITVPPSLDLITFDQVLQQLVVLPRDAEVLVDARPCTWASPGALIALLMLAQSRTTRSALLLPGKVETAGYWSRNKFIRHAGTLFDVEGPVPDEAPERTSGSLIEITRLEPGDDLAGAVQDIVSRLRVILSQELSIDQRRATELEKTFAEVCLAMVARTSGPAWFMGQLFNYKKRGGRRVLDLALSAPDTADTASCIDVTQRLRGHAYALQGKVTVRAGTERHAWVPAWDDDVALRERLPRFVGVQLHMLVPEQVDATRQHPR